MALKQMDQRSWVFALSNVGIAIGQRQGLSLMEGPYPGTWKMFPSTPGDACGSQCCFTAHHFLIKVLSLSQTSANLLGVSTTCLNPGARLSCFNVGA